MMDTAIDLLPGDPAPWFRQRTPSNPQFAFDTAAGRYLVLCFLGSAGDAHAQAALRAVAERPGFFDDNTACFFAVSVDPGDETAARIDNRIPGYRVFWDFDLAVSKLYGAVPPDAKAGPEGVPHRRFWLVIDPTMRVLARIPFGQDQQDIPRLLTFLDTLPPPERFAGFEVPAPVLVLPNVFEPELCRHLIQLYERNGGQESGFMRDVDGKTVALHDASHKRRRDYLIEDRRLSDALRARFVRRVVPEIFKVHQFQVTRMERYIVSCYDASEGGHFSAHRDNTTKGTAHRRFAVSVNLNDDFEGGWVSFPEYGPRGFKAPAGGAVVFSCSLLHKVSPVTSGRRYAFLPFLYDDAAARIREANNAHLGENVGQYRGAAQDASPVPSTAEGA